MADTPECQNYENMDRQYLKFSGLILEISDPFAANDFFMGTDVRQDNLLKAITLYKEMAEYRAKYVEFQIEFNDDRLSAFDDLPTEAVDYDINAFRGDVAAMERALEAWPACRAQAGPEMKTSLACRQFEAGERDRRKFRRILLETGYETAKNNLVGSGQITWNEWEYAHIFLWIEMSYASRTYSRLHDYYDSNPTTITPAPPDRRDKYYDWNAFHLHKLALEASIAAWKACKPRHRKDYFSVSPRECAGFVSTWETVNAYNKLLWTGEIDDADRILVRSGPITDAGLAEIAELNAEYLDALFLYGRALSEQIIRLDRVRKIFESLE